jgi:tetratricopeptide (TPR) repeat protein
VPNQRRMKLVGFGITCFVVLLVYLATVAPTVSFWDCGEFIACSYILGVPHPPGTPLQVLLGRIFSLLPLGREIAYRVNLFSVLSGMLISGFLYLIVVEVIERFRREEALPLLIVRHGAGIAAGLIAAFLYSNWSNSVEAEVYSPGTVVMIAAVWLALRWRDRLSERGSQRILLVIVYLLFLGIGIHLLPLLAFPGILAFVLLIRWKEIADGRVIGVAVLLMLLGVTTYLYLMIRAHHDPGINEVNPTTLSGLWEVFARKQYGPQNVFQRQTAQGTGLSWIPAFLWQLKGYGRYYLWQYMPFPRMQDVSLGFRFLSLFAAYLFTAAGVLGMVYHAVRERASFVLLFLCLVLTSVGIVFYLNQKFYPSDPIAVARGWPIEVRERHYFFAASHVFFVFFIGMGLYSLGELVVSAMGKPSKRVALVVAFAMVATAGVPFAANIGSDVNRSGNWIAHDYGYNMLASCDDYSVLFTNGDNDTFPLWFMQEVKGFKKFDAEEKKGCMVANLSLLNTSWYIKQLKHRGVPISFTDEQIDQLTPLPVMWEGKMVPGEYLYIKDIATRDIIVTNAGLTFEDRVSIPYTSITMPAIYLAPAEEFGKVIDGYQGDLHVFFAVTVARENLAGLEEHLSIEGLVYRLVPERGEPLLQIDVERTKKNIHETYRFDGIFDPSVVKDENTEKLLSNYSVAFFRLAGEYQMMGMIDEAIAELEVARKFQLKGSYPFSVNLGLMYQEVGKLEDAQASYMEASRLDPENTFVLFKLGTVFMKLGDQAHAESTFTHAIELNRGDPAGWAGLLMLARSQGDSVGVQELLDQCLQSPRLISQLFTFLASVGERDLAIEIIRKWVDTHPGDEKARDILEKYRAAGAQG